MTKEQALALANKAWMKVRKAANKKRAKAYADADVE